MAASQGDIQALEQAFHSGSDMDCADYDNRWVMSAEQDILTSFIVRRKFYPCTPLPK